MACYYPIPARDIGNTTKSRLVILSRAKEKAAHAAKYATHWLPCGTCLGCREAQALTWTIRLKHEMRSHSRSTFLTLTYADNGDLPTLNIQHLQKFWKRLRKHVSARTTVKYFACGEYGDKTKRAHYHAAVFGLEQFPDSTRWDADNTVSETLNGLWTHGLVTQSELNHDRIAYVAGYVLKKAGYRKQVYINGHTGALMQPPFRRMSQGLGHEWLKKYAGDLKEGCVHHDGYTVAIPRYYQDKLKQTNPSYHDYIKDRKTERREQMATPDRDRLNAAEKIRLQQIKRHKRDKI